MSQPRLQSPDEHATRASGVVLDIQRFSLHDGPGIRTLVFLKGCPLRCDWCQNPESQERMPVVGFYAARCKGFMECAKACAHNAVRTSGHRIDYARCDSCFACVDACPTGALKQLGRQMTSEEIMESVLTDRIYFAQSGGGLTVSGGEPLVQPGLVNDLFHQARRHGIHTVLETCGHFSWRESEPALLAADLIYFDLKLADPEEHRQFTGASNRLILENAGRMTASLSVEFRIPLVPGITDTKSNLTALARLIRGYGKGKVHLLRYHNMGESKIAVIAGPQEKLGLSLYSDAQYEQACAVMLESGISVIGQSQVDSGECNVG